MRERWKELVLRWHLLALRQPVVEVVVLMVAVVVMVAAVAAVFPVDKEVTSRDANFGKTILGRDAVRAGNADRMPHLSQNVVVDCCQPIVSVVRRKASASCKRTTKKVD